MVLVRVLLALALGAIGVAGLLYLFSRNRRYLKFIWQIVKFTIIFGVIVLLAFALDRLVGPLF